jgi:DHA2 family multidrug resistance protein
VIQGEIGATPSEGTWIGTAYLVAEIVVIPLTAWLERLMGMRRLLLAGAIFFTVFSVICGSAPDLPVMICGRVGQGLAGGVLIPSGLTIVARRLPPAQQPVGLALVAMAALLGPATGPVLGGWLTENYTWHYAFYINVPMCAIQATLLLLGVARTRGDWRELAQADWLGIAGMVIGLGAVTTLLEEGHREQWFESAVIWRLAGLSLLGFGLIALGQIGSKRPVIRLALLGNRSLSAALFVMMIVGLLLFGGLYVIPQYLAAIAGYNALQAGEVSFIGGLVAIPTAFLYPAAVGRVDMRWVIGFGMILIAIACWLVSHLTADAAGAAFTLTQVLIGMGTTFAALPLQQIVLSCVSIEDSPEANSLMSVARNLGGSLGLAAIASFQDQRFDFHYARLSSAIGANDASVQAQLQATATLFGTGPEALTSAYRLIDGQVSLQALVMTFDDMFLAFAVLGLVAAPLVIFLKPFEPGAAPMALH